METWKKIQKKNKRNEILGIVCMGVCLTIGIICDWNVLVKNNVLIQIEDITSFSLTILQMLFQLVMKMDFNNHHLLLH